MVIEYLLEENRILKSQFDKTGKKLRLTNQQRMELARKGNELYGPAIARSVPGTPGIEE